MDKNNIKYKYSIDLIIDEIMKDAGLVEALFGDHQEKTVIQQEVDNIVKFIKNRNKILRTQGQRIDIREFAKSILQRFL